MNPHDQNDEFAPKKAVKAKVKLKIGLEGPSNSGKTEGALALATNFGSIEDPSKPPRILLIDTENESASLYADRYDFDTIVLKAPYTCERYKKAMYQAVKGGYDWLIVDSLSHEWDGEGGILRQVDKLKQTAANEYTVWGKVSPDHEAFIEFIKQIPCHTICTMRSKQAYVLETNGKGKQVPRKVGLEPVQRAGVEYEFSLVFTIEHPSHQAIASKNRTGLFEEPVDLRDPGVPTELRLWLNSAAVDAPTTGWTPNLGTVTAQAQPDGNVAQKTRERAPQAQPPRGAERPAMITDDERRRLFELARQSGYADEETMRHVFQKYGVKATKDIAAVYVKELLEWAAKAKPAPVYAPGEQKAREAAKLLGLSESDLMDEFAQAEGDWEKCLAALSANAEVGV